MRRENVNDFLAFIAVAREQSFTKAAAQLGVSQSALSYTVKTLEARLGLRLLTRTTRSVALTETGRAFFEQADAAFGQLEAAFESARSLADDASVASGLRALFAP